MNETRKYYQKLNNSRRGFDPKVTIIRDRDGSILTDVKYILMRWQKYIDKLLNGVATRGRPPEEDLFLDDGNAIDPPTHGEVEKAIASIKTTKPRDRTPHQRIC